MKKKQQNNKTHHTCHIHVTSTYFVIEFSFAPSGGGEEGWIRSQVATGQVTQLIHPHYHTLKPTVIQYGEQQKT